MKTLEDIELKDMDVSSFDLDEDLSINEKFLAYYNEIQPELMRKYSFLLAQAQEFKNIKKEDYAEIKNEVKEEIEKEKGKLDIHIRKNYKDYGFDKLSSLREKAIEAIILNDENFISFRKKQKDRQKEAHLAFLKAERIFGTIEGMVKALENRKKSIENAITLSLNNMYSVPKIKEVKSSSEKIKVEGEEEKKRNLEKLKSKLKK